MCDVPLISMGPIAFLPVAKTSKAGLGPVGMIFDGSLGRNHC